MTVAAPPPPRSRLSIGITGHRAGNAAFATSAGAIETALAALLARIERAAAPVGGPVRLHSLLFDGTDQIAAMQALALGWEVVAPLPFGQRLNTAINAPPGDAAAARALLAGMPPADPVAAARAAALAELTGRARVFELAEDDDRLAGLVLAQAAAPGDIATAQALAFAVSDRVALAAGVMIEQSDFVIGVWDGATTGLVGGTGHTVALALAAGSPVVWIDARAPDRVRILRVPEALAAIMAGADIADEDASGVEQLVEAALRPLPGTRPGAAVKHREGVAALDAEQWRPRSQRLFHGYRRIEAVFGTDTAATRFRSIVQTYETPDAIAAGSARESVAAATALTADDADFVGRLKDDVLRRFAWADGISARLSDTYRGGMILNFVFSAFAIVGGIAYLPLATADDKWAFALFELALLAAILVITFVGQRQRWHGRWFETRRVAEYLRHAPILLVMGVARPAGRWPRGAHTSWPEFYARQALREVGLPQVLVTPAYLRAALSGMLLPYVTGQRDYHRAKAHRLEKAHHRLDRMSEVMFTLAVVSVSLYLGLWLVDADLARAGSKLFTFLGVLLPTFGGAISGIRFFGDFERFAAISEVTAGKLDGVAARLALLLGAPDAAIDYARAAELVHATDDIVTGEIESWQAVFGGKHITVPV